MSYLILGFIQGLTEFLPVSSSGHLVITKFLLNLEIHGAAFETFVHLGTSLAVIVLFRKDILIILSSFFRSFTQIRSWKNFSTYISENDHCKFGWLLIISTIPGAIIGFYFHTLFERLFSNPILTCFMFIITGFCLFFTDKYSIEGSKNIQKATWIDALLIGFAQTFAIIPGISRSGFTIMMGLMRKFNRKIAAKYSFILSIPIIIGASIFKMNDIFHLSINPLFFIGSGVTAFLSGYWAMTLFTKLLINYKLRFFSYYLWSIAIFILLFNIFR